MKVLRKIPFVLGGISVLVAVTCTGFCTILGIPLIIYFLNPWLLIFKIGHPFNFLSSLGELAGSSRLGFTPIADSGIFDLLDKMGNPVFFFLTTTLFWRSIIDIFSISTLSTEHKKEEKKFLLTIALLATSLVILSVAINLLHGFFLKTGEVSGGEQAAQAIKMTLSDRGNESLCANIPLFGDGGVGGYTARRFCYFSLAIRTGNSDLCNKSEIRAESDKYVQLCENFVQRQKNSSLNKTACEDFPGDLYWRCPEYLGVYFQDKSLCEKSIGVDKRWRCAPPFIFSK